MYKPSARKKAKKKVAKKSRLLFVVALVLLVLLGLYLVSISPLVQVRDVRVEGTELLDSNDIKRVTAEYIRNTGSATKPGDSLVFLDNDRVEEYLRETFRKIDMVAVSRTLSKDIVVRLEERKDTYVFCDDEACKSVDGNGYVFRDLAGTVPEGITVFGARRTVALGDTLLAGSELEELLLLVDNLKREDLVIESVYEYAPQIRGLVTKSGTLILIPFSENYDETFNLLKKMISTRPFRTSLESKDFAESYVYINAQFGKKIFSCRTGEVCQDNYSL